MNAEKFVKNEAKTKLSGKWPAAIFAALELLFVPIISIIILMLAYALLGESDDVAKTFSESPVIAALFGVFHMVAVLAFLLLSPIYSGFVRIFAGIADGKSIDPADLFYFFDDKKRYKNAVRFMTGVIVKSFGLLILCCVVGLGLVSMSQSELAGEVPVGVGVAFLVIGLVGAFLLVHRFAFSVMLFSYYDYDPESAAAFGAKVAKGNTQKLINLSASFWGWILLTFFVVPFVYVYPYMTCSYFVSVKYIIEQYKEQYGEIANSYADQKFKIDLGMDNVPQKNNRRKIAKDIPPITEDKIRDNHFAKTSNSSEENVNEDDTTAPTTVLGKSGAAEAKIADDATEDDTAASTTVLDKTDAADDAVKDGTVDAE